MTDYSRDLEEMQNVSREDYLASLRRLLYNFAILSIFEIIWFLLASSFTGRVVVSLGVYPNIVPFPGILVGTSTQLHITNYN